MKKIFTTAIVALSFNAFAQIPTNGLVGRYPFNGNANDISGNNYNGTNNGATLTTDRFGNSNAAYNFNGSSFISVPSVAATGNTARSIFSWVKFSGSTSMAIVATGDTTSTGTAFNLIVNYGTATLGVMGYNNDFYPAAGATINNSQWHLVGTVYDGAGNIKTYVDANLDQSGTIPSYSTTGQRNFIGKSNDDNLYPAYFNGDIDDILIYNRALTQTEITQIFNATNCTIPTSGLVAEYPFSGNTNDISGNNYNGTNNGATLTTDRFGNSNAAYNFNGSSFISVPSVAATGNTARSIFSWVKFSGSTSMAIVATGDTTSTGTAFNLIVNYGTATLGVMGYNNDFYPAAGATINNSQWHLVGTVYDGAGNIKTYVDATLDQSGTIPSYTTTGQRNFIGKSNHDVLYPAFFNGDIDDILIYNRALTQTEINDIFCNSGITTGTNNNLTSTSNQINIFPNPTADKIFITGLSTGTVTLYNSFGQLIFKTAMTNTIDISTLPTGIYFVRLSDSKGTVIKDTKIIKE